MKTEKMGVPAPEEMGGLSSMNEIRSLSFLEVSGIDSFLSRLKITPFEPFDMKIINTTDDLIQKVPAEDRNRLRKAIVIVSEILNEAKSSPDDVVPEDEDIKYKDLLREDTLSQALFARIVRIRLNK